MEFLSNLNTPSGFLVIALALGVVFVNGFTDAPNAIATTVATGALSMNRACILCALCNLFGLATMSLINMRVAKSVFESADFGFSQKTALIAVLATVVTFSLIAWLFSMPSSESHALIASIGGVSLALSRDFDITPLFKIALYMITSCIVSFLLSLLAYRIFKRAQLPYKKFQIASCAGASFMHGAQDGQKFIGILLFLCPTEAQKPPISLILAVCIFLFLGTLLGGGRIVRSMGDGIATLNPKSAFVSDASAILCLGVCSLFGFPVSTSNIKACSIVGAGVGDGAKINVRTLVKMAYVAILTFPACIAIGYALTRLLS